MFTFEDHHAAVLVGHDDHGFGDSLCKIIHGFHDTRPVGVVIVNDNDAAGGKPGVKKFKPCYLEKGDFMPGGFGFSFYLLE